MPKKDGAFYKVSPWFLAMEEENYYLVAYDSEAGKIKHYRVDKMLKIGITEDLRECKELFKNFDMGEYVVETSLCSMEIREGCISNFLMIR
ncbi:hypothetical protein CIY_34390 [Butyrivibrio fibrisolvens 16/4]|nr:hypothetical protein CIY_34390 [Butyrivibrio fibrisolvens 16/4]